MYQSFGSGIFSLGFNGCIGFGGSTQLTANAGTTYYIQAGSVSSGSIAEFVRDGVESVEGEELRLCLISPLRPGLLRGAGDDYRYLLMPIRLNV